MDIAAMLRRDREEWAALAAVLDARPQGAVHAPEGPEWTARDVYAHLARWIGRSTDELEARLAGVTLEPLSGSDDEINARWQRQDAGLTFEEARRLAHRAFERRIGAIQAVPAGRWEPVLSAVAAADGHHHYAAHRQYVLGG